MPLLFKWLKDHYPECLLQILADQTLQEGYIDNGFTNSEGKKIPEDRKIEIDCYALDLNAIVHPVCQRMYKYGEKKDNRLLARKNFKAIVPHQKQVFSALCREIKKLKDIINPTKKFLIMIDGTAGLSKQSQQRQRRFRSGKEKETDLSFDSNSITTGSLFMSDLSRYIHGYIQRQMEQDESWQCLEIVFSNEKIPGEGEHKIIDYIRKNPSYSYCIHSPDADLIMLTLGIPETKLYIFRENIYRDVNCKYFFVDVGIFKVSLLRQLRWASVKHEYSDEYAVYDFILSCFLLGNDFLPHSPSLSIANDGLEVLFDIYPVVTRKHGHFVYKNKNNELCLNTKSLKFFFFALKNREEELLIQKFSSYMKYPDPLLNKYVTKESKAETKEDSANKRKEVYNIDFDSLKKEFYATKFDESSPKEVCMEYFKGLLFVLRYYLQGIPDWHYTYRFNYTPFFSDMYKYISKFDGEMKFDLHDPLTPFEQLLAVMPPQSANILPSCLRSLILSEDSPILDFYPETFEIDYDGMRQEYMGITILPFVDVDRLKKAYNELKGNLSPEEVKMNSFGKTIKYFMTRTGPRTAFF